MDRRKCASMTLYVEYGDGEPVAWWSTVFAEDGDGQTRFIGSTGTCTSYKVAVRDGLVLLRKSAALEQLDHVLGAVK